MAGLDDDQLRAQREVLVEAFGAVLGVEVPIIAAVHGYALGGGCELALCCDLVVAADDAVFGLPEVGLGLIPGGGGTQLLSRRVGLNRALDLILTGRRVTAAEALGLGLADRVVPAGSAGIAARRLAEGIAAQSPISLRAAKRAIRQGFEADLASGPAAGGRGLAGGRVLRRPRSRASRRSVERRAPHWPSWAARRMRRVTEHAEQLPQPVELPVDERESALPLRAQLVRFVITGGLSAVVDFGLLVILMRSVWGTPRPRPSHSWPVPPPRT